MNQDNKLWWSLGLFLVGFVLIFCGFTESVKFWNSDLTFYFKAFLSYLLASGVLVSLFYYFFWSSIKKRALEEKLNFEDTIMSAWYLRGGRTFTIFAVVLIIAIICFILAFHYFGQFCSSWNSELATNFATGVFGLGLWGLWGLMYTDYKATNNSKLTKKVSDKDLEKVAKAKGLTKEQVEKGLNKLVTDQKVDELLKKIKEITNKDYAPKQESKKNKK
ncbi:MAG: hypothetical protein QM535_20990 [Limnohabitans sp.]|nr:hypothetical protein [Limnohabitans sp.]